MGSSDKQMQSNLTQLGIFRLLHQIANHIRNARKLEPMLRRAVEAVGHSCELDRCCVLLVDDQRQEIELAVEFCREPLRELGVRRYRLKANSEWYRILESGRPVPLAETRPGKKEPGASLEFEEFVEESESKSLIAFPMVVDSRLVGCLTLHYCHEDRALSEELVQLGEVVGDELALGIMHCRLREEKDFEGRVFCDSQMPLLVLDKGSCRILRANAACQALLGLAGDELRGLCLLELFAASDRVRLESVAQAVARGHAPTNLVGLAARRVSGEPLILDVSLSGLEQQGHSFIFVTLMVHDDSSGDATARGKDPQESTQRAKVEEMLTTLSRQLNWERIVRHITSILHASLDRDAVLQMAVDSLGRSLGASRCFVVRTDGPTSSMVTHEYVEPDISPLGLGRTSQFPLSAVSCFKTKTLAIFDLADRMKPIDLPAQDLSYLIESGFRSLLGTPISHHGMTQGVLVIVNADRPRQWSNQEIELVEIVSNEMATALNHAQNFAQLQDQLFNMSLIGTLSQQLTSALDMATRVGRMGQGEEGARQAAPSPPLSLRELEVLRLIAQGLANREIAQRLFLTESTVELHASRIRKKLKLKSRTALVKYACDNRLV